MRKEREEIGRANEKEMRGRVIRPQPSLSSENKEMLLIVNEALKMMKNSCLFPS